MLKKKSSKEANIYKTMFEMSPEAIVLLDNTGKILKINGRLHDWLGYEPKELIGKSLLKIPFLPKKERFKIVKNFGLRMLGKKVKPYELIFITKDGEEKVGLINARPIKNKSGHIIKDLIMISDITDHKEYEAKIADKEERLKHALKQQRLISEISVKFNLNASFKKTMNDVLSLLLKHIKVGRIYIFKNNKDGKSASNIYEKCAKGVSPQIKNLQDISYESISPWKKMLDKDNIVKADDIKTLPKNIREHLAEQDIKSILVLPIHIDDKTIGFIGFDAISDFRKWNEAEVELLRSISGIIANAYLRKKITKKLKQKLDELEKVNNVMIGRELKMLEMKKEIIKLKKKK